MMKDLIEDKERKERKKEFIGDRRMKKKQNERLICGLWNEEEKEWKT